MCFVSGVEGRLSWGAGGMTCIDRTLARWSAKVLKRAPISRQGVSISFSECSLGCGKLEITITPRFQTILVRICRVNHLVKESCLG